MLKISEPSRERFTRKQTVDKFTVEDAVDIVNSYTDLLWEAVDNRIQYAGLEDMSSCAFSEALAEGVFNVYQRDSNERESLTLAHAHALSFCRHSSLCSFGKSCIRTIFQPFG